MEGWPPRSAQHKSEAVLVRYRIRRVEVQQVAHESEVILVRNRVSQKTMLGADLPGVKGISTISGLVRVSHTCSNPGLTHSLNSAPAVYGLPIPALNTRLLFSAFTVHVAVSPIIIPTRYDRSEATLFRR